MTVPRVPAWARPRQGPVDAADAAFVAGAALAGLDSLLSADLAGRGVWLDRLALGAAAAAVGAGGRPEDAAAIRDAVHLTRPGDDPGPAGRAFAFWRRLVAPATVLDEGTILTAVARLGLPCDPAMTEVARAALDLAGGDTPAVAAAAAIAALCGRLRPDAGTVGLWLADAVLARRLGWPHRVPLMAGALLRRGGSGGARRLRTDGADWVPTCHIAFARAAATACDLAADLTRRAAALQAVQGLRAKGAPAVVALLMAHDAVNPSAPPAGMTDRAMRRLFERLVALGVVRELTGRSAFRLYGL